MSKSAPDPSAAAPDQEGGPADAPQRPSKTQLKRQAHEWQRLGQRLVDLPPAQLRQIELPEALREQIEAARRISSREALRRQLQYVGRLMRDADVEAIRARLAVVTGQSEAMVGLMHRCERLREELLADDRALTEFVSAHPGSDAQWLHAKIRAARRERADGSPPRHLRELYRWLHQTLMSETAP